MHFFICFYEHVWTWNNCCFFCCFIVSVSIDIFYCAYTVYVSTCVRIYEFVCAHYACSIIRESIITFIMIIQHFLFVTRRCHPSNYFIISCIPFAPNKTPSSLPLCSFTSQHLFSFRTSCVPVSQCQVVPSFSHRSSCCLCDAHHTNTHTNSNTISDTGSTVSLRLFAAAGDSSHLSWYYDISADII